MRLQSAMEYLMTYGWAILIIAVVLGAIYSLGLFNGAALAPRAQPGSCQVIRPNGVGTTQYISLAGACTNELPQYVAQFDGTSSVINTGTTGLPLGNNVRSAFAWVYITSLSPSIMVIYDYGSSSHNGAQLRVETNGQISFTDPNSGYGGPGISVNKWHFVGYSYSAGASNTVTIYVDGQSASGSMSFGAMATTLCGTNPSTIGKFNCNAAGFYFGGSMANIQVYNTSLDSNSVQALYLEGVGGAPINLQNLVAWWPLNGNANDYSGNLNNGVPNNVIFTNQWTGGYTIP